MLADRPALLYPDSEQRAERALADDTKSPLDVMLIAGADEADRICAAAVAALKEDTLFPVVSLLSVLPAERLLGVYFALPVERRGQCESDPVWAYHLRRVPDGIGDAEVCLRELAEVDPDDLPGCILESEEAAAFRKFSDGVLRQSLGMPLAGVAGHHGD